MHIDHLTRTQNVMVTDINGQNDILDDKLVVIGMPGAYLTDVARLLPDNYTGTLLVDTLLNTGNKPDRFMRVPVKEGRLIMDDKETILIPRESGGIRSLSCDLLRQYGYLYKSNALTPLQVEMIRNGLTL